MIFLLNRSEDVFILRVISALIYINIIKSNSRFLNLNSIKIDDIFVIDDIFIVDKIFIMNETFVVNLIMFNILRQ